MMRGNVLILLALVGVTSVGMVYCDESIEYFSGSADEGSGCAIGNSPNDNCCPSLFEGQTDVLLTNPGLADNTCGCRCSGTVKSIPDPGANVHDYCAVGQGYTSAAHTRFTTLAGGAGGAEGASSSFAAELHPINNVLILSITIFVMFITL